MEMSQGITPCSYLKQKHNFFSFTKFENRKTEQILSGDVGISGGGGESRDGM
jgi:hypothetical protein